MLRSPETDSLSLAGELRQGNGLVEADFQLRVGRKFDILPFSRQNVAATSYRPDRESFEWTAKDQAGNRPDSGSYGGAFFRR